MSKVQSIARNGSPYTIRVQRQMADHTVIDASFIEPDDERAKARLALLCDAMDARMIAVNEKILGSSAHIDALVEAKLKARDTGLNGGTDHADSGRAADLPADS
jgi:hypothetical protein